MAKQNTDSNRRQWNGLSSNALKIFKASECGDVETLRSLLGGHLNSGELLLQIDWKSRTALHYALNRVTAQVLVNSVEPKKLKEFLWVTGIPRPWTALDRAAAHNRADVVEYLCALTSADESLLDGHLLPAHLPLHATRSVQVARILTKFVPADKLTDFLLHADKHRITALHAAAWWSRVDMVEYLCGLSTQLSINDELQYMRDIIGKTALQYCSKGEVARTLIEASSDKRYYINLTDKEGRTAAMYMTELGRIDVLDSILQSMYSELGVSGMKSALLKVNKKQQNIFHIACISPLIEDLYEVLEEYLDCVKVEDLFTADIYNNTPFTYLVARYSTRLFAHFILKFPLWQRRILLSWKNRMETSCLTVSTQKQFQGRFYMHQVLCNNDGTDYFGQFHLTNLSQRFPFGHLSSPEKYIKYDVDLFRVMKYALNEYSLLDQSVISAQSHVPALTSTAQIHGHEQPIDESSVTAQSTLQFSSFDTEKLALEEIQGELYKFDVMDKHSEPKVIVVRCSTSDLVRYVSPPGPDFIIITLVSVHSASNMFSDQQTKSFGDIEQLLGYLKRQDIVKCININSTMARHYGPSSTKPVEDHVLLSGASKGKALIICSRRGRDKWEIEHGYAYRVMEQFGLQVECLYDKSADDILAAIAGFSKSSGHGSLTALCIMSHGDLRGNIWGDGGKGLCSVQQVVDALCQPDIQFVTKMIFLSYCRGPAGMPTCNRTNESWETKKLKFLASTMLYNPILKGVDMHVLNSVRASHPFPSVDVPENCYICYATLPDSTSLLYKKSGQKTDQMFVSLSDHLSNIYRCSTLYNKRKVAKPADNSATDCVMVDEVFDTSALEMDISTTEQVVATSTQQQLPRVELIPLLIDVTAIVREKSEFTQYMNYCYVVTKEYKPVVLEILPINVSKDIHVLSTK